MSKSPYDEALWPPITADETEEPTPTERGRYAHAKTRLAKAKGRKARRIAYLHDCLDVEDWHGVQDAASDLREIDTELEVLEWVLS